MTTAFSKITSSLMISQMLASTLEVVINKALALSSADSSLEKLNQKNLTLILEELGYPLSFTVCNVTTPAQIIVTALTERADCTISTSINTLRELKAEQQITELIKQNKLDLTGDVSMALSYNQSLKILVENIDIDWQSELANYIGDIPTYKLTQLGQKLSSKIQFATKQIKADASEYIVHEKRLVVTRNQVEQFNQQVSEIEKQVDDISQRISRLVNQNSNH